MCTAKAAMDDPFSCGAASEEQRRRARALGIDFPENVPGNTLASRIAEREYELDPPAPWLRQVADHLGLGAPLSTRLELFHLIEAELMGHGRELEMLVWFLYGVSRHLAGAVWDGPDDSGITTQTMERLAARLLREPWVMRSLEGYLPGTLYRFGDFYGRTDTFAFKIAARALRDVRGSPTASLRRSA